MESAVCRREESVTFEQSQVAHVTPVDSRFRIYTAISHGHVDCHLELLYKRGARRG
jgi:hypothetical protein